MAWFSAYGTGTTIHGIEHDLDGRVEFTVWLSVLWIPILPISSWSARYVGEAPPNGVTDDVYEFVDLIRKPHDWLQLVETFTRGLCSAVIAVGPFALMTIRINGRAAKPVEFVLIIVAILWCVGLIFHGENLRKKRLEGE